MDQSSSRMAENNLKQVNHIYMVVGLLNCIGRKLVISLIESLIFYLKIKVRGMEKMSDIQALKSPK